MQIYIHIYVLWPLKLLNRRTPLCNNRRVDSVRHIPITYLPEKARIRNIRAYVRAVKPLNRSPGKLAEKFRIQYVRDTRIYGLPHCGSRDRIPPRVEFSPENSRYSRRISRAEIAKNSRIKFRYLKKRREISHLIISSEPIYEAEARIFIVQSATKFGSRWSVPDAALCKEKKKKEKNPYIAIARPVDTRACNED